MPVDNGPLALPVHHFAYAVEDLESAIHDAVETLGAGPFLLIEDVPLETTSRGEPAQFVHSAAFGQCGSRALELMQIKTNWPQRITNAMHGPRPSLNHIGYVTPSPAEATEQLEQMGLPEFLHAKLGEIEFTMHDAKALWGHNIEVHADNAAIRSFWQQVHDLSIGWDGSNPIRRMTN